ncbi:MAG TPA: NAD(P)/FAD-dependent oxidoreductase [Methanobacteriaceae archaeon]|nr:NAD(P)/FAD-dependent oxidoreductase [Methanobacteriaceae archaeon]
MSVIIIGAGIAGLAAGCYLQMNGFESRIFEMHNKPGGLCTAWKRKDYTFDLCISWLTGSSPQSPVYSLWEELGVVQDREFITIEYGKHVIDEQGNKFIVYADPDKLRDHMLSFSIEDEKLIKRFTSDLKKLGTIRLQIEMGIIDLIKMIPLIRMFRKYSITATEMASKFKNPVLRNLFQIAFNWYDQSMIVLMLGIAQRGSKLSGYPIGGSLPVARAIERRYMDLGGDIFYNTEVRKIIVENNKAVGVQFIDGSEYKGDIIVSGADGHSTIFQWLDGQYIDDKIQGFYENLDLFPPLVFVSLGVNDDYSNEPHYLSFPLKNPITVGGGKIDRILLRNHSFDPNLAPEGKTVFTVMIEANYDYWAKLKGKKEEYLAEKKNIEESMINAISEIYPGIEDKIEVIDVATPLTFVRYTGNWRGSHEGWLWNQKVSFTLEIPQTLPGLSHFYMAGQWVSPGGGLFGVATTARKAVKMICKNEKQRFVTTKP